MASLIDNPLAFSKMARQSFTTVAIAFEEMVKSIAEETKTEHPGRNILWNISSLPAVQGDPILLKKAWLNLTGNAVKHNRNPATMDVSSRAGSGDAGRRATFRFSLRKPA